MATPDRTNELCGVTAAVAAARIERIQLCRLRTWRLWRRKGTLAGYTTNQMVRNNRGHRRKEVFGSVNRATFRWDDHPCCLEFFHQVCPRPATLRPWSSLRESVPDLPMPGLSPKGADKFRDVEKCASPWLHNQRKSMSRPIFPIVSAMERIRRCIRDDRTFVMFSQRCLIHRYLPSNVSPGCRTITAIGFRICACRSPTVATSAAPIACRRNCRSGCRAGKS